jgi:formate dehydrogenase gamma subunit
MSNAYVLRFTVSQRVEHFVTMVVFALLCLTGLPQKFFETGWAAGLVSFFGGIDTTRWIHRVCGIVLALSTVVHFANGIHTMLSKRVGFTMVPTKKDFEDAILQLRYYLGMTDKHPQYDRYDYKQKFEYWGVIAGGFLMISTGIILWFPVEFARLLPGEFIPAAKAAHSNEALLAFLVIIIWHIYNSIFSPEVFPLDTAIFTGKISRERMVHEHPVELARIEQVPVEEIVKHHHHGHASATPGGKA